MILSGKKVMVTGGESMIGRAICQELMLLETKVDPVPHSECDLLNINQVTNRFQNFQPDYIIHAAGWNGGIKWNKEFPATIYYRTAAMALNVYIAAVHFNIKKVVGILASCSYPDKPIPSYKEETLWDGRPNPTVECHGLAKRIQTDFGRQISKQYDVKCISCILNNCYGPYDSFHPDKAKVVSALIRRVVEAKQQNLPDITCWGTGTPLREFLYAEDAGRAVVKCLMGYNDPEYPINITSNAEISIKNLILNIVEIVDYKGDILWDITKPDGQMRKNISGHKFRELVDMDFTPLEIGLAKTVEWYINNKEFADNKGF